MSNYPDFLTSTRYGYPDGLCGVNCRHSFFAVASDIMPPRYSKEELAEMAKRESGKARKRESEKHAYETVGRNGEDIKKYFTNYEASQEMRRMERVMRKTRAKAAGLKAGGNTEAYQAMKNVYKEQRKEYEEFANAMGRKTEYNIRVYVDGLGKI